MILIMFWFYIDASWKYLYFKRLHINHFILTDKTIWNFQHKYIMKAELPAMWYIDFSFSRILEKWLPIFLSDTFTYTFDQQNKVKQKITLYFFTPFLAHLGEFLGCTNCKRIYLHYAPFTNNVLSITYYVIY